MWGRLGTVSESSFVRRRALAAALLRSRNKLLVPGAAAEALDGLARGLGAAALRVARAFTTPAGLALPQQLAMSMLKAHNHCGWVVGSGQRSTGSFVAVATEPPAPAPSWSPTRGGHAVLSMAPPDPKSADAALTGPDLSDGDAKVTVESKYQLLVAAPPCLRREGWIELDEPRPAS